MVANHVNEVKAEACDWLQDEEILDDELSLDYVEASSARMDS